MNKKIPRLRLLAIVLLAVPVSADPDPLDPGVKAAGEWVRVRLETVRLESEWATQRPLLESTVNGLKEHAVSLEEKRDHEKAKTAKDRQDIDAMNAKIATENEDLRTSEARLKEVDRQLIDMRPSLPPRLSDALELSYRSLAGTSLAAGERMQLTMNVLNRCSQFNRMVTSGEEVLSLGGGTERKAVQVIYWGLGRGYALDPASSKAWIGSPGPQGWRWEERPEAARAVAELMAVYNDKADPDFILVPARLAHLSSEPSAK